MDSCSPAYTEFRAHCHLPHQSFSRNLSSLGDCVECAGVDILEEWVDVYTHRLIFRVFDVGEGSCELPVYKMVGTVRSLMCRVKVGECTKSNMRKIKDFALSHRLQWCIALLDKNSTVESGRLELLGITGERRIVDDSLLAEMHRLGIMPCKYTGNVGTCFHSVSTFPTVDGHSDRGERSIGNFVESAAVFFDRHSTLYGIVDVHIGTFKMPGQGLNLPVYFTHSSFAFQRLLLEISILWRRSFDATTSYARDHQQSDGSTKWLFL
jgi:hypothetical protein